MSRVTGPRYDLEVAREIDGCQLKVHRNRMGVVEFLHWKPSDSGGRNFSVIAQPNLRELKRLRDWLNRVIAYVERP